MPLIGVGPLNPKTPCGFLVDRSPTGSAAGEVIAADFFDEAWQVRLE
jgi:hypothetical protein